MLVITPNAPKRGPLFRATAFEIKTGAPGPVVAFDPATEDAGIDVAAALARDFFESVMQRRFQTSRLAKFIPLPSA